MKQLQAGFVIGAAQRSQFPESAFPEFAFVGRSNVGKSSLLNSLILNSHLAKISSTPGKTRQINFYAVADKWVFADLPGYGYAKFSKSERESLDLLMWEYIQVRNQLRIVFVLLDARHDPQSSDLATIERLEHMEKSFAIILTKTDKINTSALQQRTHQLHDLLQFCRYCRDITAYSVLSKLGRDRVLHLMNKVSERKSRSEGEDNNG